MHYTKEILVKDYFDIHNFYSNIYGENKTIIMMQVGSFHECYCTDNDGADLIKISQLLDIVCTKKNGKESASKSNPRMIGFPINVKETFIEKLCNLNFTVIVIDQTSDPPKPKREIVGIFSPATFINSNNLLKSKSNYLVSLVIDKKTNKSKELCIGIASYDLSTGQGSFYETYSNSYDLMLALDDAIRYLETCPPREIILYYTLEEDELINNMNIKHILAYLGCDLNITFNYNTNKLNTKIAYQKVLFEKIFTNINNIFEITNLDKYNWSRLALTNLYDYAQNHQVNLISHLKLPIYFLNNDYLYIGNHALNQLDIFTQSNKSLFDLINYTKTLIGKRYLKLSLSQPLIKSEDLENRYNLIENLLENNKFLELSNLLEDISDLERLIRRLELEILHPYELNLLYLSFYQISKIINFCSKNNLFNLDNSFCNVDIFIDYIKNTFNLDNIINLNFTNFNEYTENIFKRDKYKDNDELHDKIISSTNFMENLIEILSDYIDDNKTNGKKLTLKYNDREGHHLLITTRRCEILKNKLEQIKEINVGTFKINITDLEFTQMPKINYIKITCNKVKLISNELVLYKIEMASKIKENFKLELGNINNIFKSLLNYWAQKIGYIDFITSGAICAIKNHYTKPIIKNTDYSYFISKDIRHPIVENINTEYEYKPHNISLGENTEQNGILLYGINSSGKSTLMKAIGINIILAQIGYFTASKYFEFSPYKSLFTRICGNDNLFKGLSSFMIEMIELTSILKRNNKNTLVIGDEICRGTEEKSANIIVAYMLKTLSESKASFITATHLHKLATLPTVVNLSNVKAKHLKLTYDSANDKLIFDRELMDGQGETFYGLTVAKYLMHDGKFNSVTFDILNEYDDINIKQTKYNSNNYLIECEICKGKDKLETHHINFQKDFDDNLIHNEFIHLKKDAEYNLVTLCSECHDNVDRNKIIIKGWNHTSKGKELVYLFINNIAKTKKYTDDFINFIKLLKTETKDPKFARIKIKEKLNIKVSTNTIKILWA